MKTPKTTKPTKVTKEPEVETPVSETNPEITNRIKEILKDQGRSQAWLAGKIGKSYVVTTNYCNNKTTISLKILRKMAEALDVDVRELLVPTK